MHSCLSGVSAAKYASYRLALLLEETDNDLVSVLAAAASFLAEGTEKISTAQASILLGHLVSYSAVRNSTTHVNTSVLVAQVLRGLLGVSVLDATLERALEELNRLCLSLIRPTLTDCDFECALLDALCTVLKTYSNKKKLFMRFTDVCMAACIRLSSFALSGSSLAPLANVVGSLLSATLMDDSFLEDLSHCSTNTRPSFHAAMFKVSEEVVSSTGEEAGVRVLLDAYIHASFKVHARERSETSWRQHMLRMLRVGTRLGNTHAADCASLRTHVLASLDKGVSAAGKIIPRDDPSFQPLRTVLEEWTDQAMLHAGDSEEADAHVEVVRGVLAVDYDTVVSRAAALVPLLRPSASCALLLVDLLGLFSRLRQTPQLIASLLGQSSVPLLLLPPVQRALLASCTDLSVGLAGEVWTALAASDDLAKVGALVGALARATARSSAPMVPDAGGALLQLLNKASTALSSAHDAHGIRVLSAVLMLLVRCARESCIDVSACLVAMEAVLASLLARQSSDALLCSLQLISTCSALTHAEQPSGIRLERVLPALSAALSGGSVALASLMRAFYVWSALLEDDETLARQTHTWVCAELDRGFAEARDGFSAVCASLDHPLIFDAVEDAIVSGVAQLKGAALAAVLELCTRIQTQARPLSIRVNDALLTLLTPSMDGSVSSSVCRVLCLNAAVGLSNRASDGLNLRTLLPRLAAPPSSSSPPCAHEHAFMAVLVSSACLSASRSPATLMGLVRRLGGIVAFADPSHTDGLKAAFRAAVNSIIERVRDSSKCRKWFLTNLSLKTLMQVLDIPLEKLCVSNGALFVYADVLRLCFAVDVVLANEEETTFKLLTSADVSREWSGTVYLATVYLEIQRAKGQVLQNSKSEFVFDLLLATLHTEHMTKEQTLILEAFYSVILRVCSTNTVERVLGLLRREAVVTLVCVRPLLLLSIGDVPHHAHIESAVSMLQRAFTDSHCSIECICECMLRGLRLLHRPNHLKRKQGDKHPNKAIEWGSACFRVVCDLSTSAINHSLTELCSILDVLKEVLDNNATHMMISYGVGLLSCSLCSLIHRVVSVECSGSSDELEQCYKTACRVLTQISSSPSIGKHSYMLVGAIVHAISAISLTRSVRELLLPGIFALVDSCSPRHRKALSASLSETDKACLAQLTQWYEEDYKFTGNS